MEKADFMKEFIKKATVASLLSVMLLVFGYPVNVLASESDVGNLIDAYVDEHGETMAGMAVSVMDSEDIIYTGYYGFADMENNVAVDDETVMEWGSISKLQVWVCVMQLKEKNLIDLNADIRTYLPDGFLTKLRYETPITMTNLMNHQAGFDEVPFIWAGATDQLMSIEEWLKTTEPEQQFEPGTVTSYSNWGATLAAFIVSRVSGQPYEVYVKENIYEPLGMDHTSIMPDASDNKWVCEKRKELKTYSADLSGEILSCGAYYCYCYPVGACMSTMADMQKFAQALLSDDSPLFEKKETRAEMLSPSNFYGDTDIGSNYHGFWQYPCYSGTVIGHEGGTVGCSSTLRFDLDKGLCIAVMVNQHEESQFINGLPGLIFESYEGNYPEFSGILQSAQAVYNGPFKLHRLFAVQTVSFDPSKTIGLRVVLSADNGIDKVECGTSDNLVREPKDVLPDIISILEYLISILMAIVLFIAGVIQFIRYRKRVNSLWCVVSAGVQLIPVFVLYRAIMQLVFEHSPFLGIGSLRFLLFLVFAVLAANILLFSHGIRRFTRSGVSKTRMILTFIMLAFSTYGIIYWELFEFWSI